MCNESIETSSGIVSKDNGKWYFRPEADKGDDYKFIPFTDHWTYDTLILRHHSKYGIYTLPNMSDYGNDGSLSWVCMTDDPFPYDEVCIKGLSADYLGYVAYRIGVKWGINYMMYVPIDDNVVMRPLVPCKYNSLADAEMHLPNWRNPFLGNGNIFISPSSSKKEISENTILANIPGVDAFQSRNAGAIRQYLRMSVKEFKEVYERQFLKGRGSGYYDDLIKHINSLLP